MLRVQTGLRTSVYFITQFFADFSLYIFLTIPSFLMVLIGYRYDELQELEYQGDEIKVDYSWLILIDLFSKVTFGCILLPFVYLFGFLQRHKSEHIFKSLGLILYIIGHLMNMILLSVVCFISNSGKSHEQIYVLYIGMLNPFTFNFFNAVLDYFFYKDTIDNLY